MLLPRIVSSPVATSQWLKKLSRQVALPKKSRRCPYHPTLAGTTTARMVTCSTSSLSSSSSPPPPPPPSPPKVVSSRGTWWPATTTTAGAEINRTDCIGRQFSTAMDNDDSISFVEEEHVPMETTFHHPKSMKEFLPNFVSQHLNYPQDNNHRYFFVTHLFDDTKRMLDSLQDVIEIDTIIGIPYSSNATSTTTKLSKKQYWQSIPEYGHKVHINENLMEMEQQLIHNLSKALDQCHQREQQLILIDCGGYLPTLLHAKFPKQLHFVKGVVEITKQGIWRAQENIGERNLAFPLLHCADSELKRLEAKRCGETIARCVDGISRDLGLSLAGRQAIVFGAGWIGSGVATALKRLDMIPIVVDNDPLKVVEARLNGFVALENVHQAPIEDCDLIVGATGRTSITSKVLDRVSGGTMIASASSRQMEIDMEYLQDTYECSHLSKVVDSYYHDEEESSSSSSILVLNDGYPVNFIPNSASVPDEIVELILAEIIMLMQTLSTTNTNDIKPGIHRIPLSQERFCAQYWLQHRHRNNNGMGGKTFTTSTKGSTSTTRRHFSTNVQQQRRDLSVVNASIATAPEVVSEVVVKERNETTTDDMNTMEQHNSPYLVQRLLGQGEKPNLYGVTKFAIVAEHIRSVAEQLDRPVRILDLGCSTSLSKSYLHTELGHGTFEYCGVDYEAAFSPDLVMDIREIHQRQSELPWTPDIILLLDVLEHLPGKAQDIAKVMKECDLLVPDHGLVLAVVPQLYRLDRLKLPHLHYPEHQVRFTLEEWTDIIDRETTILETHGIGYISCLSYLPMLSPYYKDDNFHGSLFRYLRGTLLEWHPLKSMDIAITRTLGRLPIFQGWCNSTLLVCHRGHQTTTEDQNR